MNINRSVKQGCPLLFAVATHPLFSFLENQASTGKIQGLHMDREHLLALGIADDPILFLLHASNLNIGKCMSYLALFSLAVGMNLNVQKSQLIDMTTTDFNGLEWLGKRVKQG